MSDSSHSKSDIGLAILLTCGAGLATTIGATLAFCVRPSFTTVLPISLAFSAGVMIYVSFIEILSEGLIAFEEELIKSHPKSYHYLAHIYLSLAFFVGISIGYIIDYIVHLLGYDHDVTTPINNTNTINNNDNLLNHRNEDKNGESEDNENCTAPLSPKLNIEMELDDDNKMDNLVIATTDINGNGLNIETTATDKSLIKTSLITAFAIALHNFPEGLATFVSTLANPTLGISIAVAIAIHNIPEGVSVALPIYFATNNKYKAFGWAFLSGIFEPIGGLIGYAIIDSMFNDIVFGVLFGFTAGVMIYISFKELLPTARKKDVNDKYCTVLVFVGFFVMDLSLILFEYAT